MDEHQYEHDCQHLFRFLVGDQRRVALAEIRTPDDERGADDERNQCREARRRRSGIDAETVESGRGPDGKPRGEQEGGKRADGDELAEEQRQRGRTSG